MSKEVVRTDAAPGPFQGAPYSQAIRANGFVFVAGQLGLRARARARRCRAGSAPQTEQALRNLRAILEAAGTSLAAIVKTTVFLQDLDDFAGMNEVYARHVGDEAAGALDRRGGEAALGRAGRDRGDRARRRRAEARRPVSAPRARPAGAASARPGGSATASARERLAARGRTCRKRAMTG